VIACARCAAAVQTLAHEGAARPAGRDGDAVVTLEVPGDSLLAEVVCLTKVEGFFLHLRIRAEFRVLRAGLTVNQSLLAIFLVGPLPAVVDLAGNSEMATSRRHVTDL
jgi:hypothetical protein